MTLEAPECSRAGCRAPAAWNVKWRNPRIHSEDRVKVWLACDEHRDFLYDYLSSRGFPVRCEEWVEKTATETDVGR